MGRNPEEIERSYSEVVVTAEDSAQAEKRAAVYAKRLGQRIDDYLDRNLVAEYDEVARYFKEYIDVGVTYFVVYFPGAYEIEPIETFAREIIPRIRETS